MLLVAVPEETYCLKSETHAPVKMGSNMVCYRCGFLVGPCDESELGSLVDV